MSKRRAKRITRIRSKRTWSGPESFSITMTPNNVLIPEDLAIQSLDWRNAARLRNGYPAIDSLENVLITAEINNNGTVYTSTALEESVRGRIERFLDQKERETRPEEPASSYQGWRPKNLRSQPSSSGAKSPEGPVRMYVFDEEE